MLEYLKDKLKKRFYRLLIVLFLTITISHSTYKLVNDSPENPKYKMYYFTLSSSSIVESPNNALDYAYNFNYDSNYLEQKVKRCNLSKYWPNKVPAMVIYKDIQLCNDGMLKHEDFNVVRSNFEEQVNKLWLEYYLDYLKIILYSISLGLIAVITAITIKFIFTWILKGEQ